MMIKSRRMRLEEHVARMEEMRNAYILVGKPEGNILLERSRRRLEDNIKIYLKEICGRMWTRFL
jgi:hypothetical protein